MIDGDDDDDGGDEGGGGVRLSGKRQEGRQNCVAQ